MKPNMKLPWRFVPWHIEEDSSAVRSPEGWIVCTTSSDADAKFIAHACNTHDDLVSALTELLGGLEVAKQDMKKMTAHMSHESSGMSLAAQQTINAFINSGMTALDKARGGQP